jgi:hypothetical protein
MESFFACNKGDGPFKEVLCGMAGSALSPGEFAG